MLDGLGNLGYFNAALLFCALVFVHELGHFLLARWHKVTVEVFSIGFGPELVGWNDRYGTRWRISLIPLGGYIKMLGEDVSALENSGGEVKNKPNNIPQVALDSKSIGARAAIAAAGPLANFIFAAVLFAGLFMVMGRPMPGTINEQGIGVVMPNSPAEQAGLMMGDRIIAINGNAVRDFADLVSAVENSNGNALTMKVIRGHQEQATSISISLTPQNMASDGDAPLYRIGVGAPSRKYESMSSFGAISEGITETWRLSVMTLQALWQTISGSRSADELGGPIKIVQLSNDISQFGWAAFISFAALLSINLGLLNLLPIPVLDGGHLLFLLIEKLRGGRPLDGKAYEYSMRFGMAFILGLMIFVTINDVIGLFR